MLETQFQKVGDNTLDINRYFLNRIVHRITKNQRLQAIQVFYPKYKTPNEIGIFKNSASKI